MNLNLGSGQDRLEGYVNVDLVDMPGVDVALDLDKDVWPWDDESINVVRAFDIFEHVDGPLKFMNECWRVLRIGGRLLVHTTHWKMENSFSDPTHRRFCTERTFDYWVPGTEYHARYGAAYSGGRHFDKTDVRMEGQELSVKLLRADRCEGSC